MISEETKDLLAKIVFALAFLMGVFLLTARAQAATVSPIMGLGSVQAWDNNGNLCTGCVLYTYQAGTTIQQPTYTDSTGSVSNPNPVPFSSGARAQIWLTTGAIYKLVLCLQNDGAACSPSDVLFSIDQVPGGTSGGGGGGGSPFISGSSNPATTGILRLASGDSICFRNAANSANLCISKDSSDVLSWASGTMKFPETACSLMGTGFDYFCADSTAHRWKMSGNGGGYQQIVGAGVDINTSDQVTQLHFGSTPIPLSSTAPTANQFLQFDGTNLIGQTVQNISNVNNQAGTSYTLVIGDAGGWVRMSNGSANSVTVPPNSSVAFQVGTVVNVRQVGAGQTTIVAGVGVTLTTPSSLLLRTQNSTVALVKVATDTWDIAGDLQ